MTIEFRIMAALYGKRRPRSVDEILEFLNTESPGPNVTEQAIYPRLYSMVRRNLIRWVVEAGGYLRTGSKYTSKVGKPWSSKDKRDLAEIFRNGTPLRVAALKLRRFEEEIVAKRPTYGSRKK